MAAEAWVVAQDFPAGPPRPFCPGHHYLLYAEKGALRLEADGRRWSLPPARAALVAAGTPVLVTLPQPVRACSAMIAPSLAPDPPSPLAVFEVSALARELLRALRPVLADVALDARSRALFAALIAEVWSLSARPTPAVLPLPASGLMRRALDLMEADLAEGPDFEALAAALAVTPRTLARRFAEECGTGWRAMLRRMRMIRALELLTTGDAPVAAVAAEVGYGSLSAFNAAFRDFAGAAPRQVRDVPHRFGDKTRP